MDDQNQGATAEVEQIEPVSMDDTIRDTLRGLQEKDTDVSESTSDAPESPEEKANRIRDNSGKFAKPDAETTDEKVVEAAPESESWNPPNTWKKDAAEKLRNADPSIREEVARREADFHRGIDQYKDAATFGHAMNKAIEPYMATINSFGLSPDQAVSELMKADQQLRSGTDQQRTAFLVKLANDYGIDIKGAANYEAPYVDPQVATLQQQLHQVQSYIQNQNNSVQQQEQSKLNSEISAFAADEKHSHFESVKGHMAALLQAGQASDLKDAYEQAVWANPTTRSAVLAKQQADQRAEAAQKAQAAKKAASVNHRSRPSMPAATPIGTMDETIRDTFRRLQSGT